MPAVTAARREVSRKAAVARIREATRLRKSRAYDIVSSLAPSSYYGDEPLYDVVDIEARISQITEARERGPN